MKKFVFVGSHGTGKSSAATFLAAQLKQRDPSKSVKVIEENVREIARLVGNKLNTPEFQRLCMVDHIQKEVFNEMLYDIIVCDRTAIDTLVYGLVYRIPLPAEYYSLALNHLDSFTTVFFVRPDSDASQITDDGFRDTDAEMRKEVDLQFEKMLALWGGKVVVVKTSEVFNFDYLKHIE